MTRVTYIPERKVEAGWRFMSKNGSEALFLYRDLTPPLTQDDLAKIEDVADAPTLCKLFGLMYGLRDEKETENARQFIQNALRKGYPSTLTRIAWMPKGSRDIVMQRYGTRNQTQETINLVGSDGEVQEVLEANACKALTGTTPANVKKYIDWINETNYTGIRRFNSKPEQREESVVWLDAYSNRADLNCVVRYPTGRYPALRVSRKKF
jgi:hypothetical protein